MCKDIASCVLIIVNSLFLLVSVAMVVVGGLLQWGGPSVMNKIVPTFAKLAGSSSSDTISIDHIAKLFSQYASVLGNAGLIIFIIGLILLLICVCGSIGVCCKNNVFMMVYLFFTVFIWILLIIFIIIFFTKRSDLQAFGGVQYRKLLESKYTFNDGSAAKSSSGLDITGIIDLIQARLHCCGSTNHTDFFRSSGYNTAYGIMPYSCCKMVGHSFTMEDKDCPKQPTTDNSFMNNGCYSYFWEIINKYSSYAGYGLIGLSVILFFLIVIAIVLLKGFGKKE